MPVEGMPERAHTDSVGEVMLRLASAEEKYRLDSGASAMFRTALAPEDALGILRTPNLKLQAARNPSALLVGMAKDQVQRAREERLLGVVPMLRRIDRMRDQWGLDEEAEGLLKFGMPSTVVLEWLEQIGNALREIGSKQDAARFVKSRLRRMICDLRAAEAGQGPPAALPSRDEARSRHRSRSRSRDRRRDVAQASPAERFTSPQPPNYARRPPQHAMCGEQPHQQPQPSLRAVPPPVAPGPPSGRAVFPPVAPGPPTGKFAGSVGKGGGKGAAPGWPGRSPAGDAAGDAAGELMAQIQKLQSQLETAKRGL